MYLGIDLGTSEVKVLLLAENGQTVGHARAPLIVSRPAPHWAEQNPHDWWRGTLDVLGALRADYPAEYRAVRAIGLSGQMHGPVLLGRDDRVLRPTVLWNDTRSALESERLARLLGTVPAIAGSQPMPGFSAPILMWLAAHEPDVFAQLDCVLLPKDYLRLKLTGERQTDPSDAAGTLWLDVARRTWSDALLEAGGMTRAQVPPILDGGAPAGYVLPSVAATLGLSPGVVVATGGGDNAASAAGIGATQRGDAFLSLGTSGVLSVIDDRSEPSPVTATHAFCHAIPARWLKVSVVLSAASCLRWVCKLTSTIEATLLQEAAALDARAMAAAPVFLPYLSGERTPHNDAYAEGVFFGLTHSTDRARLAYSVLEGVAFAAADGLLALEGSGIERPAAVSLIGGGARSAFWAQLMTDVLRLPVRVHLGGEAAAALGAARLGWIAAGASAGAVLVRPREIAACEPDPARFALLDERLQRFRELYRHVRPLFAADRARLA
ncbi:xylulokinase [Pararobbsia silviterrae]|uniref:Xylulose kinase n=1 Tax=Pararobbsia silviterrae TaxID=1792498 RepID=A0A494XJ45_9BURK|nr:xylulokinase [Pararobbsia silviterrae]RKP48676.1 xylulokinase [Pararobbsia silviterrae]